MQIQFDGPAAQCVAGPAAERAAEAGASGKRALMWLNQDRVLYVGLLGAPSVRTLGAYSIYLSLALPHRISVDGGAWQTTGLSIVPPQVPHRIVSDERMICNLLVESETVTPTRLPAWMRDGRGAIADPEIGCVVRRGLDAFQRSGQKPYGRGDGLSDDFDRAFFGEPLPRRLIDRRIGEVLARIRLGPNQPHSAEECAALIHVSVSRFLHLFKAEVGVAFRSFRTWQRARSVLYLVTQTANLTTIALDVGYPDSTHFSHSIRHVFGLTPKSIFAGCRQLALYAGPAAIAR